jgi:hypothetical protein
MSAVTSLRSGLCAALLLFGLVFPDGELSDAHSRSMQKENKQLRSSFRYAIVSNEIVNVTGDAADAFRYVVVLMDQKAFSEENLKELFKLVSARFPTPNRLDVQVYTNLEQVETPEEHEQGKVAESPDNPVIDKYHWALFIRSQGNELIRYNPNPPDRKMKTIILKGKDPTVRDH